MRRRAQSYTDFHYAARAVLRRQRRTDTAGSNSTKTTEDLEPLVTREHDIRTDLDFSEWFQSFEDDLLESSHNQYTYVKNPPPQRYADIHSEYLKALAISESHLDGLLEDTSQTLDYLDSLSKSFRDVEAQTTTFQKQCEGLVHEKQRIASLADGIAQNLKYYSLLEPVTRRLNAPGAGSLVKSQEFSEMLARIDECIDFMITHVRPRKMTRTLLIFVAQTFRVRDLSITVQTTHDKRLDSYPCPLCWQAS